MEHQFSGRIGVDFDQPLDQMIAAGDYTWVSGDVAAEHFPRSGRGKVECEARLCHFDQIGSSEEVVRRIRAADRNNPWEPGQWEHVLAVGAQHPMEQTKSPIPGMGSVAIIGGRRGVLCLYGGGTKRNVRVDPWEGDWALSFGFLAVRRITARA
jgi:hypothetical protein